MHTQEKVGRNFFAEGGSKFEPLLIKMLCEPLLPHIPAWVHPNTISLVTHGIVWMTALLAMASPELSPLGRAIALLGAGVGMFLSMLGDCLDGLHARRTNQCSKLGEMLDHWLDAVVVPLGTAGITAALEMPAWAMISVNLTAAMIYHAQLVLYHHTGKFVHPEPATGPEAQFGLSLGYVTLAGFLYCVDRHQPWLDMAVAAIAVAGTFVQLRCTVFFFPKLGHLMTEHCWFVGLGLAFGALFLLGAIDAPYFLFCIVFTSFRISGTYVLRTIVGERYDGKDMVLFSFVLAIAFVHYRFGSVTFNGVRAANWLAAASCFYAIARNFLDFSRHYAVLKPRAA
ncbi:MAG: CDP-alcohol phosphatidyltransferase family protein [Polyangiales bacterium]